MELDLFGLGLWLSLVMIGLIVVLAVWMFKNKVGGMGKFFTMLAVVVMLIGIVGFASDYYTGGEPAEIVPSNSYSVTCAEAEAEIAVNEAQNLITWKIGYNTTANNFANSTGAATLNFTIAWKSGAQAEEVQAYIGAVPEVDQSGSAADVEILDENSDGTSNAAWVGGVKGEAATYGTEYEALSLYMEPGDNFFATVIITLEASAFEDHTSADEGDSWSMVIYVAGTSYTIDFILWDVY